VPAKHRAPLMISGSRVTIAESISTSKEKSLALDAVRAGFLGPGVLPLALRFSDELGLNGDSLACVSEACEQCHVEAKKCPCD